VTTAQTAQDANDGVYPTSISPTQAKVEQSQRLTYPSFMSPTQDRIKFQAYTVAVDKRNLSTTGGVTGVDKFKLPRPGFSKVNEDPVFIAIQAGISDQNSVDWGPDSLNAIDAAIFRASYNTIEGTLNLPNDAKLIADTAQQYKEQIKKYLAGQAAGINNVLARTDGIVLNPNLELLFQGPQLRPFSFQFKMSAREQSEATQIKAIIKYFKKHMAVKNGNGLFLQAPNVFKIEYQYGKDKTKPHPGINLIKECALTNFSVDYTPLGSYMTYEDGTMVAYSLSMQFQELTPVYHEEYTDHEIGF